jgi:hypothetical protein
MLDFFSSMGKSIHLLGNFSILDFILNKLQILRIFKQNIGFLGEQTIKDVATLLYVPL